MTNAIALTFPILRNFRLGLSLKILWIFIFLIIFSLISVCIFQLNLHTKEIYLIQEYEKNLNKLSQENRILEINFSNANSLGKIENYLQNQVFEKVGKVEYIQILEGTALAK